MPSPNRLDAVEVHNTTAHALSVTVVYDDHKDKTEMKEEAVIMPGGKQLFAEKELNMGTWTVSKLSRACVCL